MDLSLPQRRLYLCPTQSFNNAVLLSEWCEDEGEDQLHSCLAPKTLRRRRRCGGSPSSVPGCVQTDFTEEKAQRGWMAGWDGSEATISPSSIHSPRAVTVSFPGHSKMATEVPGSCPKDSDTWKRTCLVCLMLRQKQLKGQRLYSGSRSNPSQWGGQGAGSLKNLFTLHLRSGSSGEMNVCLLLLGSVSTAAQTGSPAQRMVLPFSSGLSSFYELNQDNPLTATARTPNTQPILGPVKVATITITRTKSLSASLRK